MGQGRHRPVCDGGTLTGRIYIHDSDDSSFAAMKILRTKSTTEKEIDLRKMQGVDMALTRDFKETVKKRVGSDPDFAKALLHEAIDLMLDGDSATAKLILRDLISATVGFERLAEEVHKPSKSHLHHLRVQRHTLEDKKPL